MAQEPEVIRQNIEETRSELTRKIEVLEQEVVGTVKGTTAAVAETVENVRGTVEDTVGSMKDTIESTLDSVKDTFDVSLQVRRHPWAVMGGSVFAGYVLGSLLPATRPTRAAPALVPSAPPPSPLSLPAYQADVSSRPPAEAKPKKPSLLTGLLEQFSPEIQQLKGVAIGAVAAMVRDAIKDRVPPGLEPHVQDMIHNVTHKLGGEEIKGPILPQSEERDPLLARHEEFAGRR